MVPLLLFLTLPPEKLEDILLFAMNINYKEAQFEFFPESARVPDETKRPHFMAARFNLSIENLVIFSIVSIMVVIFAFSLGVERGKQIALAPAPTDVVPQAATVVAGDPAPAAAAKVAKPADNKGLAQGNAKIALKTDVAPVAPQAKTTVPAAGGFTIQVASYKSEKGAQREASVLKGKGYQVFMLPKGQHIALCVGCFQSKMDASVFGKKLKGQYQDFVVRRL